ASSPVEATLPKTDQEFRGSARNRRSDPARLDGQGRADEPPSSEVPGRSGRDAMTSLRELLDEIANRAEPADGLADRALARADRRRRTWFPTVTAAVAVASVVALVAVAYPIVNRPADE